MTFSNAQSLRARRRPAIIRACGLGLALALAVPALAANAANPAVQGAVAKPKVSQIDFKRGDGGAGRLILRFDGEGAAPDLRNKDGSVVVEVSNAILPAELQRPLNVTDFATPVQRIDATAAGNGVQLVLSTRGGYESLAYQTGNEYVVEVSPRTGAAAVGATGSGTTGAVAHKMGRRWIMVELGEHCHTHIIPRLQKVIDGQDSGGITQAVDWKGGGGFRYYRLAPSLIVEDRWGNPVINPEYNPAQLAEALCKLEGFTYAPSETHWWQHGHSSERDFLYVTTQTLSAEQLQALADEVGEARSLLVCCSAFRGITGAAAATRWPNLTLKKIPKMVLARCEWGHDDYSLNVANLPMAAPKPGAAPAQDDLFGEGGA